MKINTLQLKSPITFISLLSIVGGITYMAYPSIIKYGMYPSDAPIPHQWIQLVLYSFLHGGALHILSNVIFFLFIGRIIEITHGAKYTWWLWIWTTIFVGGALMLLATGPTIGWSGFAMALLSIYTLDFYKRGNPEYKWWLLLIGLNIGIGLYGNISLLGHLVGALAGFLYGIAFKKNKSLI
jgi:membrane associated rhomboid family serine protease